jgi:outer membrane immunogenic protein
MKQFLLGAVALLAFGSAPTLAADLPVKAPPPPPVIVWSWTGFYIGADVGGDWARDIVSPTIADGGAFPRTNRLGTHGVFGGGTAGYNFQNGLMVYGIEADFGYMGGIRTSRADLLGGTEIDFIGGSGFYGDVTGRIGFTYDRLLLYAKGGYAFLNSTVQTTTAIGGFVVGPASNFSGFTVGGGLEYKVTPQWSLKGEYMYFDFGTKNSTLTGGAGVFPYANALTVQTLKFGVNYLFGGPVIAKF